MLLAFIPFPGDLISGFILGLILGTILAVLGGAFSLIAIFMALKNKGDAVMVMAVVGLLVSIHSFYFGPYISLFVLAR